MAFRDLHFVLLACSSVATGRLDLLLWSLVDLVRTGGRLIVASSDDERGRLQLLAVLYFLMMLLDQLLLKLMLLVEEARVAVQHDVLVLKWLRLVDICRRFDA